MFTADYLSMLLNSWVYLPNFPKNKHISLNTFQSQTFFSSSNLSRISEKLCRHAPGYRPIIQSKVKPECNCNFRIKQSQFVSIYAIRQRRSSLPIRENIYATIFSVVSSRLSIDYHRSTMLYNSSIPSLLHIFRTVYLFLIGYHTRNTLVRRTNLLLSLFSS